MHIYRVLFRGMTRLTVGMESTYSVAGSVWFVVKPIVPVSALRDGDSAASPSDAR